MILKQLCFSSEGRINRTTAGAYTGCRLLLFILLLFIGFISNFDTVVGIIVIFFVVLFFVDIAVITKRCHDINRSGWFQLWGLVPLVGYFIPFYIMFKRGTPTPNKYGSVPAKGISIGL